MAEDRRHVAVAVEEDRDGNQDEGEAAAEDRRARSEGRGKRKEGSDNRRPAERVMEKGRARIITWAQAPCASMWTAELVKKTITGHMRTPIRNATLGHR
jgi:hypothetical protein